MLTRRTLLAVTPLFAAPAAAKDGTLSLRLRHREERNEEWVVRTVPAEWPGKETAAILIDLWDRHWCRGASARVEELAPRVDRFLARVRELGGTVIHAPSGCMKHYQEHPARKAALAVPRAARLPAEIDRWCYQIPAERRGTYPLDQSDGGCDCEPRCPQGSPWTRQIERVSIQDGDFVSDSGVEIWSLLESRGIRNVLVLGVHTNMCVLGRPFGLRNLVRYGKRAALVRDLTDTMYNPRSWPYVNHFRGTDRIVEHIEKYVCPTVESSQLLGGRPFRFRGDRGA